MAVKIIRKREKLTRQFDRKTEYKMTIAISFPRVKEIDDPTGEGVVRDVAEITGLRGFDGIEGGFGVQDLAGTDFDPFVNQGRNGALRRSSG
jgi:hypothetical protein